MCFKSYRVVNTILQPVAIIKDHKPIFKCEKINKILTLIIIDKNVPCIASLAFPIACKELDRGD